MTQPSRTKAAIARRAWRSMFDFLMRSAPAREEILARHGLTPNDARALSELQLDTGWTMSALAERWGCDPSNATWIINRLERLHLVERRMSPEDRRVRLVVLTARGATVREQLVEAFHEPPPALLALDRQDLDALERVLRTLDDADAPQRTRRRGSAIT